MPSDWQVSEIKAEYFPPKVEIILQNEIPTDFYVIVSGAVVWQYNLFILIRCNSKSISDSLKLQDVMTHKNGLEQVHLLPYIFFKITNLCIYLERISLMKNSGLFFGVLRRSVAVGLWLSCTIIKPSQLYHFSLFLCSLAVNLFICCFAGSNKIKFKGYVRGYRGYFQCATTFYSENQEAFPSNSD